MAQLIATSNSVAQYHHAACYVAEAEKEFKADEEKARMEEHLEYLSWEANGCICLSDFIDDEDDWGYAPDLNAIEFNQSLHQSHVLEYWDHIPF